MTLEEIKRIKQEKGYTMAQLSRRSGVPLGTLQKIFTGETANPRYATRQAIEKALREDISMVQSAGKEYGVGYMTRWAAKEEPGQECGGTGGEAGNSGRKLWDGSDVELIREHTSLYGPRSGKRQGEYTLEDYYAFPGDRRVEMIDGVIYDMSAPGFVHQDIVATMLYHVKAYIRKKGGGCIPVAAPVDVRLDCDDKTMVQPDLIIVCDRDKVKRWGILGAPDFVLEIVSRSTRRKDYTKKLQKYADAGVKEYWIIDPEKKFLIKYDFSSDNMPCIYPLEGSAGMATFQEELQIDLGEIAELILEWPE